MRNESAGLLPSEMATAVSDAKMKDFNIFLTCCNVRKCHGDVKKIQTTLNKYGYDVNFFHADDDCNIHVFTESAEKSQCVLFFECSHIRKVENLTYFLDSNSHLQKKTIVAGKSLKRKFEHCHHINLKEDSGLDECVKAVMDKITHTMYGSTTTLNDYEDLDVINKGLFGNNESFKSQDDEDMTQTRPKRVFDPEEYCLAKTKALTSKNIQKDRFIPADTLEPIDVNKGPLILENFAKSDGNEYFNATSPVQDFNLASGKKLQEMSKFIMSTRIPKLRSEKNFTILMDLLKLNDCRIQTKITETLTLIQLEDEFKSANVEGVLRGINKALQIIGKRSSNLTCIPKLVIVVMNAISMVYLQTVIDYDKDSIIVGLKTERFSQYLQEIDNGDKSLEYQDLMISLKTLIHSLEKDVGKNSYFPMGNWKETLHNESFCKKLREDILKMTFTEQYACVFGIINELCSKTNSLDLHLTSLLRDLLGSLITRALKKKTESTLHSFLVLVTQSMVYLFTNMFFEDGFSELMKILMLFLDNAKILQYRRQALLTEIEPLLFHKNTDVAKAAIKFFRKNGCTEVSVRKRTFLQIERLLSISGLKIVHKDINVLSSPIPAPEWHSFEGTLCGAYTVKLNVLLPSQECLSFGCMNDYKRRADENITYRKITSLEILLHLQKTGCHNNVVRLIAYQVRPLPLFYIQESFPGQNFQSFLLTKRKNQDWLSCTELKTFVVDLIHALEFLHSKNVIHCNLTTSSFSLTTKRSVVLTDLQIAKQVDEKTKCIYASDWFCKNVPTRWISPESILEEKFDIKTDIWMLGTLIYEIFTHGCHPYTELYNIETEKVLEWVVFHELKLRKWPCIPSAIQEIILSCVETNPEERTDLNFVLDRLNNELANGKSPNRSRLSSAFFEDELYPDLDIRQKRKNDPEKGIPKFFITLKQSKECPRATYFNLRKSQWLETTNKVVIKEEDLLSSDQPNIQILASCLHVEEPVTECYIEKVLPQISEEFSRDMCIYSWPPLKRISSENQNGMRRVLVYKCHKAKRLLDFAAKRELGNPIETDKYLHLVLEIVTFVASLHNKGWIHRDICCRSLYVTDRKQFKVFSPRLGRLCRIKQDMMSDNCVLGPLYQDRINWMPIEVVQRYHCKQKSVCQYSKESDVYMLACTIYEFYKMLEIRIQDPMASELESVPFATLSVTQLLDRLYSGEKPPCPSYCPSWLYKLLVLCWNRESSRRPSINFIKDKIKESIQSDNIYEDFNHLSSSSDDDPISTDTEEQSRSSYESYLHAPVLPTRIQKIEKEHQISLSDCYYNSESLEDCVRNRSKSSGEIIKEIELENQQNEEHVQPAKYFSQKSEFSKNKTNPETIEGINLTQNSKPNGSSKKCQKGKRHRKVSFVKKIGDCSESNNNFVTNCLASKRNLNLKYKENKDLSNACDMNITSDSSISSSYMVTNSTTTPTLRREPDAKYDRHKDHCKKTVSKFGCKNSDSDTSLNKTSTYTQPKSSQTPAMSSYKKKDLTISQRDYQDSSISSYYMETNSPYLRSERDAIYEENKNNCKKTPNKLTCINSDSDTSAQSISTLTSTLSTNHGKVLKPKSNENECYQPFVAQNKLVSHRKNHGNEISKENFCRPRSKFSCLNSDVSDNEGDEQDDYLTAIPDSEIRDDTNNSYNNDTLNINKTVWV